MKYLKLAILIQFALVSCKSAWVYHDNEFEQSSYYYGSIKSVETLKYVRDGEGVDTTQPSIEHFYEKTTINYNKDGSISSFIDFDYKNTRMVTSFKYNEDGQLIERLKKCDTCDAKASSVIHFKYDKKGRLISKYRKKDTVIVQIATYDYRFFNKVYEEQFTFYGIHNYDVLTKFDLWGNSILKHKKFYDRNRPLPLHSLTKTKRIYKKGRLFKILQYYAYGQSKPGVFNNTPNHITTSTFYDYDSCAIVLYTSTIEGKPQAKEGSSYSKTIYDDKDNSIELIYIENGEVDEYYKYHITYYD